jgi:hypothetical protein
MRKLNETRNAIVRCFVLAFVFGTMFLSVIPIAFSDCVIYTVSVDPENPLILEDLKINVGVQNTGTESGDYALDVFVIKNGQIKYDTSFEFSLRPGKGVLFSPTFTPASIGEYEIVTKIYDKYRSVLYHTKLLKIEVTSDIGPFDLELDTLSKTVIPGRDIPLIVRMKNAGFKGTDVKIAVEMDCINQSDVRKEFFVFLGQGSTLDKSFTIKTCDEEGLRDITSKLILFDTTLVESLSQVFLNRDHVDFEVTTPKILEIRQGGHEIFDVYLKNTAEVTVTNLKLAIENIPLDWFSVNPSTIVKIEPNETAMFIVNVSIPNNAPTERYPIVIAVGSDQTLIEHASSLDIISGYLVDQESEEDTLEPKEIQYESIIIFVGVVAVIALIVILRRDRRPQSHDKRRLLKIKDMIE